MRCLACDNITKAKLVNHMRHDDGLCGYYLLLEGRMGPEVEVARHLVDEKIGLKAAAFHPIFKQVEAC